jgi:ParB family chromosome partitioning protein
MANRKALGRGLSALIKTPEPAAPPVEGAGETQPAVEGRSEGPSGGPLYIAISRIAPNPGQPRKAFRPEELATLAASIQEQGVLQPVVVRRRGDGYELIIGERRWRAAQMAGLDELPAVILDATDRQVVEMALVENVQRADLNPIELAQAFRVLTEDEGMTQEEAGRRVGLDRSSVANHLRLLELDSDIQQDLIDIKLSMGHAKAILQAPRELRRLIRDQVLRSGLTVRAAEELARRQASGSRRSSRPGPKRDPHLVDLEDQLRRELQTKVRIVGRPGRGRVELHYFRQDELDRLSELLLGDPR